VLVVLVVLLGMIGVDFDQLLLPSSDVADSGS